MYPAAPQEADGPRRDPRVLEVLRRELPGLEQGVPLAAVTAYGVGGPAELLVRAGTGPAPSASASPTSARIAYSLLVERCAT